MPEPEIVPENFSTTLLCMYFARACEGKADAGQPRVYYGPALEESRAWGEEFPLDRRTQVWMCRNLSHTLYGLGVRLTPELAETYGHVEPDVWLHDDAHAIIIENKDGGDRNPHQEQKYLGFLHEAALKRRKRAFLYAVPEQWLSNREQAKWWRFVRERPADDTVIRGIIAWDTTFVESLCRILSVPEWFRDKLPNRVNEGRWLDPGVRFWEAPEARR